MDEFQVGDEVRVISITAPLYDTRGMVFSVGEHPNYPVQVKFELTDGDRHLRYKPYELRLERAVVVPGRVVTVRL